MGIPEEGDERPQATILTARAQQEKARGRPREPSPRMDTRRCWRSLTTPAEPSRRARVNDRCSQSIYRRTHGKLQ
jgi:hypothetical protein